MRVVSDYRDSPQCGRSQWQDAVVGKQHGSLGGGFPHEGDAVLHGCRGWLDGWDGVQGADPRREQQDPADLVVDDRFGDVPVVDGADEGVAPGPGRAGHHEVLAGCGRVQAPDRGPVADHHTVEPPFGFRAASAAGRVRWR